MYRNQRWQPTARRNPPVFSSRRCLKRGFSRKSGSEILPARRLPHRKRKSPRAKPPPRRQSGPRAPRRARRKFPHSQFHFMSEPTSTPGPSTPQFRVDDTAQPFRLGPRPGGASSESDLVDQTRTQIRNLVEEIAELAKSGRSTADFFEGFLAKTTSALAPRPRFGGALTSQLPQARPPSLPPPPTSCRWSAD